jgi:hypothetical protein
VPTLLDFLNKDKHTPVRPAECCLGGGFHQTDDSVSSNLLIVICSQTNNLKIPGTVEVTDISNAFLTICDHQGVYPEIRTSNTS